MSRAKAIEALREAKAGRRNAPWSAQRGLSLLTKGVEPELVEPAMKLLLGLGALLASLRKLPDEYEPLARRVFAGDPTSNESIFLEAWGDDLRAAAEWRHQLDMVNDKKAVPRLAKLLSPRAVEAAQATLAAVGLRARRLLAVLAYDGSESSADVVLPHVLRALETRDATLDVLEEWVRPFARGPHFQRVLAELDTARDTRTELGPLKDWSALVGGKSPSVRFEVSFASVDELWRLWMRLDSTRLPHVSFALSSGHAYFSCDDFKVRHAKGLDEAPPSELLAFPAWLKALSKRRKLRWNTEPRWVKSSLRGKARARAVAWVHAPG